MIENCIPTEKEIEIVYDLAQRVLQYENVLVDASDICGEIDRFVSAVFISRPANLKVTVFLLLRRQLASTS